MLSHNIHNICFTLLLSKIRGSTYDHMLINILLMTILNFLRISNRHACRYDRDKKRNPKVCYNQKTGYRHKQLTVITRKLS